MLPGVACAHACVLSDDSSSMWLHLLSSRQSFQAAFCSVCGRPGRNISQHKGGWCTDQQFEQNQSSCWFLTIQGSVLVRHGVKIKVFLLCTSCHLITLDRWSKPSFDWWVVSPSLSHWREQWPAVGSHRCDWSNSTQWLIVWRFKAFNEAY